MTSGVRKMAAADPRGPERLPGKANKVEIDERGGVAPSGGHHSQLSPGLSGESSRLEEGDPSKDEKGAFSSPSFCLKHGYC